MHRSALEQLYNAAKRTDDFDVHSSFLKALLASNEPGVLEFHYQHLRDRSNRDLYLRLRAAFVKRGNAAADFLVEKTRSETDPAMRAELLHLLARIDHPAAVPMAREALSDSDPDMRHRGCYALGWLGEAQDIARLNAVLLNDPDAFVRRTAATSHSQLYERAKRSKNTLLASLHEGLQTERDTEVAGWIVLSVQYILKKRFGIKWDSEEDVLHGDIPKAREKCLRALAILLKK